MKRINPVFLTNNPPPIPGCHTTEGCCSQCCGPLDLPSLFTESPCVMVTEVLDIRQMDQSPVKVVLSQTCSLCKNG
jgi:hypothetical protein